MNAQTFTLADGTVIDATTGRPVRQTNLIEIPTHAEAVAEVTRVRKRVHELPEPPEKMNAIALVAMYHMFGLNEIDIAFVTQLTETQVTNIMATEAYSEIVETTSQQIAAQDGENVRNIINAHANTAASTVIGLMGSQDDKVAMVAAKDVLDRAGHRPADIVEHRHKVEGGLTIEYIKKGGDDEAPAIGVQYEDVTDGTA